MTAKIKLNAASGGGSVSLKAPSTTTSNAAVELQLPVADGSAGQVLMTDGSGNLSWVSQPTAGITQFDQWRYTASPTGNQEPLSGSWERNDTSFDKVGTGMTESSGVFTFPTTGLWLIFYKVNYLSAGYSSAYLTADLNISTDSGSNWSSIGESTGGLGGVNANYYETAAGDASFDVTNVSTHKVRLKALVANSNVSVRGSTSSQQTGLTFIRIGDT